MNPSTMKVVTASEMKSLDRAATQEFGIPSLLLMENAGRGIVDQMEQALGPMRGKRVVVFSGSGNNGGDGLVAARHLTMRGAHVAVFLLAPPRKVAGDAAISLAIWQKMGGRIQYDLADAASLIRESIIVDALLGTGLSHPVSSVYAEAIALINRSGRPVVSIDIPSGICADTGAALGTAVRADYTSTLAMPKRGLFVQDALEHRGKLGVVDIGLPKALIDGTDIATELITSLSGFPPPRPAGAHKGTAGHLLVVAGSVGAMGAAAMTAMAAFRCGAGLVTVGHPQCQTAGPNLSAVVEAMTLPLPETATDTLSADARQSLASAMIGKRAVAIGPGLSRHLETQQVILDCIADCPVPMVIDADALHAVSHQLDILKGKKLILTPHPGEMGVLIGRSTEYVQKNRFETASEFAKNWGVVLVLKGAHTIIALPDGTMRINNTGNPGMATAGTGDVLTGMIAGWLVQGVNIATAATWGVYLHGLAGDIAACATGRLSLMASDLIANIPKAIETVTLNASS